MQLIRSFLLFLKQPVLPYLLSPLPPVWSWAAHTLIHLKQTMAASVVQQETRLNVRSAAASILEHTPTETMWVDQIKTRFSAVQLHRKCYTSLAIQPGGEINQKQLPEFVSLKWETGVLTHPCSIREEVCVSVHFCHHQKMLVRIKSVRDLWEDWPQAVCEHTHTHNHNNSISLKSCCWCHSSWLTSLTKPQTGVWNALPENCCNWSQDSWGISQTSPGAQPLVCCIKPSTESVKL